MGKIVLVGVWLLAVSILDVRYRRVPAFLLALGGVPIVLSAICRCGNEGAACIDILKGMLPGAILLVAAFATGKAGYGDGMVLLLLGMTGGEDMVILLFGLSLFFISICAVVLLGRKKADRNTRLPYLPFLATAWLSSLLILGMKV